MSQECYLSMVMEFIPSNLNAMIKELRKSRKSIAPVARKVMAFQLFKALYYMHVAIIIHRYIE